MDEEEEIEVDELLWFECAGKTVQLPCVGSCVFYFAEGHAEHLGTKIVKLGPATIRCRVSNVQLHANSESEVYAKIRLIPDSATEVNYDGDGKMSIKDEDRPLTSLKILSDTDVTSKFTVTQHCMNHIFPKLTPPETSQLIHAQDIHGKPWVWRHKYRSKASVNNLSTNWNEFVNTKKLQKDDVIVFTRGANDALISVGIVKKRRSGVVRTRDVTEEVSKAASGQPFNAVYYPRSLSPPYCVPSSLVTAALNIVWQSGMRFRMQFESKDSTDIQWFEGTVTYFNPSHHSLWKLLKVTWDNPIRKEEFVNPWEVELIIPLVNLPCPESSINLALPSPQGPENSKKPDSPPKLFGVKLYSEEKILQGQSSGYRRQKEVFAEKDMRAHPGYIGGMCAHCGKKMDDGSGVPLGYIQKHAEKMMHFQPQGPDNSKKCDSPPKLFGVKLYSEERILQGQGYRRQEELFVEKDMSAHPGYIGGMCVHCSKKMHDGSGVPLGYIHKNLRLSEGEKALLRNRDFKNLLHHKKLYLVLDLDHILLNSTRFLDLTPEEEYLKSQRDSLQGSLFRLDFMLMLTKLRPFVRTFLQEASNLFVMYVCTMGEQSYAMEMAKLLDPEKLHFDSRVIAKENCTRMHQEGLDVVLRPESAVLILDVTEQVWMKNKENLLLMDSYHFFASSSRQFGFNCKSLSELKSDESEVDGALSTVLKVLRRVHSIFFDPELGDNIENRDVRQVLKTVRKQVLEGCKVVFSRVFPAKFLAENHPLWKMAEQLGVIITTELDPSVTHVVSKDSGTEKSRWAVQEKKFLVHPRWIEDSHYLCLRQPEGNFPVKQMKN